jgi:hypothetical protein
MGGLVTFGKTDKVSMDREILEISPDNVHVEFTFVNKTSKDLTLPVLFPIPRYSAEVPSLATYGAPDNFSVQIAGKGVQPYETLVTASDCGIFRGAKSPCRDVTSILKQAGLSDRQIALFPSASPFRFRSPYAVAKRLTPKQEASLVKAGLLLEAGDAGMTSDPPEPLWEVSIKYLWHVNFPAGSSLNVVHEYRPFTSGGATGAVDEAMLRKAFCASDDMIAKWKAIPAWGFYSDGERHTLPGSIVSYILTSANTWAGPIRDFTLRLRKTHPAELVATCFPGKIVHVDALNEEVHLTSFRPEHDLRIIFVNTPESLNPIVPANPPTGLR